MPNLAICAGRKRADLQGRWAVSDTISEGAQYLEAALGSASQGMTLSRGHWRKEEEDDGFLPQDELTILW